jgi:predicted nucleic-acid-binding protein
MIAIDTNVVVRLIVVDDPDQAERARTLIEGSPVFVSMTVILETGWVLRSLYGYSTERVVASLRAILGLEHIIVEDSWLIDRAFDWALDGLDFADALHLVQTDHQHGLATFDRGLARVGSRLTDIPIRLL